MTVSSTLRFTAVAWDVDGTLADSEPLHLRALREASADLGLDLGASPDDRFVGMHTTDIWAVIGPEFPAGTDSLTWRAQINARYRGMLSELREIPGAKAAVLALAGLGARQIAVSNSGRNVVAANLGAIGILELLEGSVCFDDVTRGKPDPEPYLRGVALLGVAPERVLAVEDSVTGARAAQAAGLTVAGLGAAAALEGAIPISGPGDVTRIVLGA